MSGKKYRRIILHAGLHKTGTTSIQNNCHRHRNFLLSHGIYYPSFRFRDRLLVNHSDPMTGAVCAGPRLYGMPNRMKVQDDPTEAQEIFSAQFERVLASPEAETLLLSGEQVCDYDEQDMQALRSRLEQNCDELRVIAFIRSPVSSLESILQQRNVTGRLIEPDSILGVVGKRFTRVNRGFAGVIEFHNFHDAVVHPAGLVGYFFCTLGVPEEVVTGLEFTRVNERVSLEAHKLIRAINEVYPAHDQNADHGVKREFMDIHALLSLPGQPFVIEDFRDSELYQEVSNESILLERKLGFRFPATAERTLQPLWQKETLLALEEAVSRLDNDRFREVIVSFLRQEADRLADNRADTSVLLNFIAEKIENQDDSSRSPLRLLDQLGADYFKYAALQMERDAPELALNLMSLALTLRPNAEFMMERIEDYKVRLQRRQPTGSPPDSDA